MDNMYSYTNEMRIIGDTNLSFEMWAIGETYPQFKNCYNGVIFEADSEGLRLNYLFHRPTQKEISDFRNGEPKFALVEDSGIQFFMSKFGGIPWHTSANNYNISTPQKLEEITNMLTCLMFDTSTGKLVAMRALGLHQEFVDRVKDGVNKQLEVPISKDEFSKKIQDVWLKYPTENKLLKRAHCRYDFARGRIC